MIQIQRRDPQTNALTDIGRIEGGTIVDGEDALTGLFSGGVPDEDELLERFRGPTLFAARVDSETASAAVTDVLKGTPIHEDAERLTKDDLANWVAWVRSDRPPVERTDDPDSDIEVEARTFNPELHPRGPDGKFVERPWDIPDGLDIDSIRSTPTLSLLKELDDAGEPIDDVLSDTNIKIDGIPDDVNSVAEAEERLGGDGVVFQDLESGDSVEITPPDLEAPMVGHVEKTEQVDGGPNIAHLRDTSGAVYEVPVPDGSTVKREGGPAVPPSGIDESDSMLPEDISEGQQVAVVTGMMPGMDQDHEVTGEVTDIATGPETDFPGDGVGIEVGGNKYDAAHKNIQVYDASPDELTYDSVSVGDEVAVFSQSGKKLTEGEITEKTEVVGNPYLNIKDKDTGDTAGVNMTAATLTEPEAYDTGDTDGSAPDTPDNITPENIDDLSPSEVGLGDVNVNDTKSVNPQDLNPGDWIVFNPKKEDEDAGVGRISDISGTGNQALVNVGDETREIPLFSQETLERVQTPSAKASNINPEDIDTADLHTPDMDSDPDFGVGDWAYVADGDAGEAFVGPVQDLTSNNLMIETGVGQTKTFDRNSDTNAFRGVPPEMVLDAAEGDADVDADVDDGPDISDIDPSSVSSDAISTGMVDTSYQPAGTESEGDFVVFLDDQGGEHVGQIDNIVEFDDFEDEIEIESGHYTDPQTPEASDIIGKVDDEAVAEVGDEPGVESTKTNTPADHDDFDVPDVEDFTDKPNPPETLSAADMKHPVSPPDEPGYGMLSQEHADAIIDAADGNGALNIDTTDDTGNRPGPLEMEFPQADGGLVKDTVSQFVENVHGIPSTMTDDEIDTLFNDIYDWKGTSYSDESQAVEKAFHAGLRLPGDVRNDGLDGEDPSPTKAAVAASLSRFSQEFIRRNFDEIDTTERFGVEADDDELPLYRGVASPAVGSLLRDWAEDPSADEITAKASKLGNFTTDASMADHWASKQVVFKENAKVEDIVMSPDMATAGETGIKDEAEIWLTGGVSNADPSNIQIRKQSSTPTGEDPMTMADLPDDPGDLEQPELLTLHQFADKMVSKAISPDNDERKYLLDSESQVATMERVLERMDETGVAKYKQNKMEEFISESVDMINSMDSEDAGGVPA